MIRRNLLKNFVSLIAFLLFLAGSGSAQADYGWKNVAPANNADCPFTGFAVSATVTWAAGDTKVCGIDVQVWSGGKNKTGVNQL